MIRKSILWVAMFFAACTEVWAEAGTIVVRGAEKAVVYNSLRGRGRASFQAEVKGKGLVVNVPEEECRDLLWLIADGRSSWIRLQPGETVSVNVSAEHWKFSGDEKKTNSYLYDWTQKFWLEKPNYLTGTVEMMFSEIPREQKVWPEPSGLYRPEYRKWTESWERRAYDQLTTAKLRDEAFVAEQRERIHYNWLELQCLNFQMAQMQVEIPGETLEFVRNERFEHPGFMDYPGRDNVLRIYFDIADKLHLFDYTSIDFLRRRAGRIANPSLRELYVLNTLQSDFDYGYLYQGEAILESVRDLVVSEKGKKIWEKCLEQYRAWQADSQKPEGKAVAYFNFGDIDGKQVNPSMFKGKYLLIDVWATWCGPCKAQIPYLKQLIRELEGRDIAFLSISADKPEARETWKKMLEESGLEEHGVMAPDAFNHKFFERYGIRSIPRFLLVDPQGNVVISKARRPSDPVLKQQLTELLDAYDASKTVISGRIKDAESWMSLSKPGGWTVPMASAAVTDHAFTMPAWIETSAYYALSHGMTYYYLWLTPGARVGYDEQVPSRFSGDHADMNNLMAVLIEKYARTFIPSRNEVFDRSRGQRLRKQYDEIARTIGLSALSPDEKALCVGYWQGDFLQKMYGSIISAKVFGKAHKRPDVRKGYSDAILDLDLLPELVHHPQWFDLLQEWLYAKLDAGQIRIQNERSWLADLAHGIDNEELRESYVMEAIYWDVLRGYLYDIENRIANIRSLVKKAENLETLNETPVRIAEARKSFADAMPGTDLSHYTFEDAQGKTVSLADFKGKYVFIDMWSTGCNPCIGEIPYIRDLEKRLSGKPIVWVSISLDLNKKVWLGFLQKNNMSGIQLICDKGFKHPFIKQIGLSGIPQFLLLDKEGKVIDANTLRPSNPVMGKLLEFILNRSE